MSLPRYARTNAQTDGQHENILPPWPTGQAVEAKVICTARNNTAICKHFQILFNRNSRMG